MTSARAIAKLASWAQDQHALLRRAHAIADLPLSLRIEVNNIQECVDLLRHKLRIVTLETVVGPIDRPARRRRRPEAAP